MENPYSVRMKCQSHLLLLFALCLVVTLFGACDRECAGTAPHRYLVLYAFSTEGELLAEAMAVESVDTVLGREVRIGTLAGQDIVLAGCGVGLINAAMTTQTLLDRYRLKALVFSGIAGGIDTSVHIGDIVVCDRWLVHDYGYLGADGLMPGSTELYDDERGALVVDSVFEADSEMLAVLDDPEALTEDLAPVAGRIPRLIVGGVGVSGNCFVDSYEKRRWLSETFEALVTDMESAAVAQVCTANGVPFVIFRSASDLAGGSGSESAAAEIDQFFRVAAENSSTVVMEYLSRLK